MIARPHGIGGCDDDTLQAAFEPDALDAGRRVGVEGLGKRQDARVVVVAAEELFEIGQTDEFCAVRKTGSKHDIPKRGPVGRSFGTYL